VDPPPMIPGIAQVQVRVTSGTVTSISIAPVYINGKDRGMAPTPDAMLRSANDPQWFTGRVWLMQSGAWEIRAKVTGLQGLGNFVVPVPAFARRTLPMQRSLGALLFVLMLFLSIGSISIAGAAAREGTLMPGTAPSSGNRRLGRIVMAVATMFVVGILALGNWWWNAQAADLKHNMLYSAPPLNVAFDGEGQLTLRIEEDYWHKTRKDQWSMGLIPDHGHLMHVFLLRAPSMDHFFHLHPEQTSDGSFTLNLPAIPSGEYKVFADIVRATGFPETLVGEIRLPDVKGKPFSGDDSGVAASTLGYSASTTMVSPLLNGDLMVWERNAATLKAGQTNWFRFRVEDAQQRPLNDLEPYMGMAGHAEFVRTDFSVFAHIHPAGSVPMASLMIAQQNSGLLMEHGSAHALPAEISFPYGFPQPGDYRLFVQIKRLGRIETGVFDAHVGR